MQTLIIIGLIAYIVISHFGIAVVLKWLHDRVASLEAKIKAPTP